MTNIQNRTLKKISPADRIEIGCLIRAGWSAQAIKIATGLPLTQINAYIAFYDSLKAQVTV